MTRIGVMVNDAAEIAPTQTTAMLIRELAARGLEVRVFGVADLALSAAGEIVARARRPGDARPPGVDAGDAVAGTGPAPGPASGPAPGPAAGPAPEPASGPAPAPAAGLVQLTAALAAAPAVRARLADLDGLLIRTNPARDRRGWAHAAALELARFLRADGAVVINDPDGLALAASKLFLARLPAWMRPATLASADRAELIEFVQGAEGMCVLKPAVGTRGSDVFRVHAGDPNLRQVVDVLLRSGYAIAQKYVAEAADGDTRVVVVDGALLTVDGEHAAVRRVPGEGDFRSNIHAGGVARPAVITDGMRAVIAHVGPLLAGAGLVVCGLDFIGDVLCEINVFSTGGLRDAERFTGRAFTARLVDVLLDRIAAGPRG